MATPTIKLKSLDGEIFTVDLEVAKMSLIVSDMVDHCEEPEDGQEEPPIPLNLTGDILKRVVEWCERNYKKEEASDKDEQLAEWNKAFLKVEKEVLWEMTRAANYLHIEGLLEICTGAVVEKIQGKNSLELRSLFGLAMAIRGDGVNFN